DCLHLNAYKQEHDDVCQVNVDGEYFY
ncbi:MAG: hypothetical protein Q611_LSC00061G0002, partial [Leuconostoc sp. DORA_2]